MFKFNNGNGSEGNGNGQDSGRPEGKKVTIQSLEGGFKAGCTFGAATKAYHLHTGYVNRVIIALSNMADAGLYAPAFLPLLSLVFEIASENEVRGFKNPHALTVCATYPPQKGTVSFSFLVNKFGFLCFTKALLKGVYAYPSVFFESRWVEKHLKSDNESQEATMVFFAERINYLGRS